VAEQDVKVELFYSGAWQDVTALGHVFAAEAINLDRGLSPESLEPKPGSMTLALHNGGGRYNPRNPASALYGLIGRNTPVRVSVDSDPVQVGEVAVWAPSRPVQGTSRCAVQGAGVLRRLGRGKTPFRPPLERAVLAGGPAAYWRLDEAEGTGAALPGVLGGVPLVYDALWRPGVVDGSAPMGGGKYPNLMAGDGQTLSGMLTSGVLPTASTTGYAVDLMLYIDGDLSFSNIATVYASSASIGGGFNFRVSCTAGAVSIELEPLDLALPGPFSVDLVPQRWYHLRGVAANVGSTIELSLYVDGELAATEVYAASSAGRATTLIIGGEDVSGFNVAENLSIGHVVVWDTPTPSASGAAGVGYLGETAADRAARLCLESGVPITVVGDPADSKRMGPQPADTLTELLLECARTDAALLFEDRDQLGFVFHCGRDLYNRDPDITLSLTSSGISPGIAPEVGDVYVRNDVEAVSSTGRARAFLESGPMSVLDPPDGVGRYDTRWEVNPDDDGTLPAHAGWHVNRGTVDEIVFRSVTVDLDANPSLASAVSALDIGNVVLLTDLDPDDSPDDVAGLLVRIAQVIGPDRRLVTLWLVPASPYNVAIIGEDAGSTDLRGARIDTDLTVTAEALDTTETGVDTTGGTWTTDADNWNAGLSGGGLFVTIGGELMRVTNRAGSTFTVVRSVNGIVKSHASGAPVHVTYPAKIGL
jgi:hypothetical protein